MPRFEEGNDLRAQLEAATDKHTQPEGDEVIDQEVEVQPDDQPADTTEQPDITADAAPEGESTDTPEDTSPPAPEKPPVEAAPAVQPEARDPAAKPPGSWTPAAREKWSKLDPEVRAEVWKREKEATRALTMSTEARKFQQEFQQAIQPYMGFIAAEKSTPIQAAVNMMQSAALLRVGTPQQKVQLAADIIRQYNIDLQALDSVLAGQQPQFNPQMQIQQTVQQTVQQQLQQWQAMQAQQQEQVVEQEIGTELERFANDPKNEFYWDLKDTMADLIEVAARRGIEMSLTEAYQRATLLHEPVRRVIEARNQAKTAQSRSQQAQRARNAASSVTSSAGASAARPKPGGDSLRADIEFAISQQQGR